MSENPFSAVSQAAVPSATDQPRRRERVKVTVYAVLGTMITFCLALLFQGCRHHEPSAENPFAVREHHVSAQR